MFPLRANEMAFMNSVVFGTNAKSEMPRNFSGMPEPSSTTSTTSTKISKELACSVELKAVSSDVTYQL